MSENEKLELLPCPFCGAAPELTSKVIHPSARCATDGCPMRYNAIEAKAWNTRPQPRQGDAPKAGCKVCGGGGFGRSSDFCEGCDVSPEAEAIRLKDEVAEAVEELRAGINDSCFSTYHTDAIETLIRAATANSAENSVKGVGVEELAKMLDKKFEASFPGIEYTMGYVGKFLVEEFPNGLKITKE